MFFCRMFWIIGFCLLLDKMEITEIDDQTVVEGRRGMRMTTQLSNEEILLDGLSYNLGCSDKF